MKNMKNIESEIFEKIKALEEIKTKIKRIKYKKKRKKRHWNKTDVEETLERQRLKIETEKIKKLK